MNPKDEIIIDGIITPAIYAALLGGAIYLAIAQNPLPNAVASVSPEA